MALPVEATSIVIRNEAIDAKFQNGTEGLRELERQVSLITDGHITSVTFMREVEATNYMKALLGAGLKAEVDFVPLREFMPLIEQTPTWLTSVRYKKAGIVGLVGTDLNTVTAPKNWNPERGPMQYHSAQDMAEKFDYETTLDNGLMVFKNKETGEKVYTKTSQQQES